MLKYMLVAGLMCGFSLISNTAFSAEPLAKDSFKVLNKVETKLDKNSFNVGDNKCKCPKCDCPAGKCKCDGDKCTCKNCPKLGLGAGGPNPPNCKCGDDCKCDGGKCKCPNCVMPKTNIHAKHPANSYQGLYRHIEKGGQGVLYIGVKADGLQEGIWAEVDKLGDIPSGIYDCWKDVDNVHKMQIRLVTPKILSSNPFGDCPNGNCPRVSPQIKWQNSCPNCPNYRP